MAAIHQLLARRNMDKVLSFRRLSAGLGAPRAVDLRHFSTEIPAASMKGRLRSLLDFRFKGEYTLTYIMGFAGAFIGSYLLGRDEFCVEAGRYVGGSGLLNGDDGEDA